MIVVIPGMTGISIKFEMKDSHFRGNEIVFVIPDLIGNPSASFDGKRSRCEVEM